jgi:Zn-dependent protease with chaperone function
MIAILTPWQPLPGAEHQPVRLSAYFSQAQIDRSQSFHDDIAWPSWLALAVGIAVPVLLGCTPLGRRFVALVAGRLKRWPAQVLALGAAVVALQRLATLPFDARAHSVATAYGLSAQAWGSWLLDVAKSTGITLGLTTLGLLGLVGLARRFPTGWFLPGGLAAALLVVTASFAYPLVLEPMFNRFTPMADSPLRTRLLTLAARDSVNVNQVLVADASKRTTALNAYVSGFGASRRLVVYDTLLASATHDEVAVVVAHELGHAAHDDVLVGTLEGAVGAALSTTVLFLVLGSAPVRRPTGAWSAGDPAVVPLVLALAAIGAFAALPVQNLVSRHIEARADATALNLTRDPETFIAVQQQLALSNLSHLRPNPMLEFWFDSHPDTLQRIEMALQWERLHRVRP